MDTTEMIQLLLQRLEAQAGGLALEARAHRDTRNELRETKDALQDLVDVAEDRDRLASVVRELHKRIDETSMEEIQRLMLSAAGWQACARRLAHRGNEWVNAFRPEVGRGLSILRAADHEPFVALLTPSDKEDGRRNLGSLVPQEPAPTQDGELTEAVAAEMLGVTDNGR